MRSWMPWFLLALIVVLLIVVGFMPPGSLPWPSCRFREWTGLNCPGCGGTRATRHLLHGHWLQAARCNVMIYPIALGFIWALTAFLLQRFRGIRIWTPARLGWRAMWVLLAILLVFTVLRNMELGWFLRP